MSEVSSKTVLCVDHGLFLPLAIKLADSFQRVLYYSPWEKGFPILNDCIIGDGYDNIERVDDIWEHLKDVDLFIFPDLQHSGLQLHLESLGKRVWGSREGDDLELRRSFLKKTQKKLGLEVPDYKTITGIANLRTYLKAYEDQFVKISRYRGVMETFHHLNYEQSQPILDHLAVMFGPLQNEVPFLVEGPIKTDLEVGYDGWSIDGQWPDVGLQGWEAKDKALIASVQDYSKMPEEVTSINEALSPVLKKYRYRNFLSTEIRVADKPFLIDITCFSEDTEVLTNNGWKRFQELIPDDEVCTLNHLTNAIEYHLPSKYISYRFEGELISISNRKRDLELLVTPNHTVWGIAYSGKWWAGRADMIPHTLSIPRTGLWNGVELAHYVLPEYVKSWHSGKGRGIDRTFHREAVKLPMDAWLRFLAIYLSEGCSSQSQVNISQTKYKKEIGKILEELPFKWTEHKKGFSCSDVQLADHVRQYGLRYEKYIPDFVKQLSSRQIDLFLTSYCLGDGHMKHGNRNISTPSERTANDIQELFLKCGSVASVKRLPYKGMPVALSGGKYICSRDSFLVMERKRFQSFHLNGWASNRCSLYLHKVPYAGMVYDVEVENHILYVRRNGKACWSGNCRAPSPGIEIHMEIWDNLAEIIWHGAAGEMVGPVMTAQFGVECMIDHTGNEERWRVLEIPKEAEPWVKLYSACKHNDLHCIPPFPHSHDTIGAVVGIGDTVEDAIAHLKSTVELLKDQPVSIHVDALYDILKDIHSAEKKGIEFSEQAVPEPEVALQ